MLRFLRFLFGLFTLPFAIASTRSLACIVPAMTTQAFPFLTHETIALSVGFFLWLFLFLFIRIPSCIYVFSHELTHACWGFCTGSKIGRIQIRSTGGFCCVSNPGIFTTLSPYFIPFYLFLLLLLRSLICLFFNQSPYALLWLALFSFTYGFHLTYSFKALIEIEQPDIRVYGRLFSYSLILNANLLFLGIGLSLILSLSLFDYFGTLVSCTIDTYSFLFTFCHSSIIQFIHFCFQ